MRYARGDVPHPYENGVRSFGQKHSFASRPCCDARNQLVHTCAWGVCEYVSVSKCERESVSKCERE